MEKVDDKSPVGTVPPYEANPSQFPQQRQTSYGTTPGQPMTQHDIYQQPNVISPMSTGGQVPNQPIQYPQQQQQGMASPDIQQTKTDGYYGVQPVQQQHVPMAAQQQIPMQQVPMQQQQQFAPMQMQQSQYQSAVPLATLSDSAAPVDCPICRHRAMTAIEFHAGNTTNVWAALACVFFCLGCIPYFISSLKDVEHKCGHCGVRLATYHRSARTVVQAHG